MLGRDLVSLAEQQGVEVAALDLPEVDIVSGAGLDDACGVGDAVVNVAAYTDVDGAEDDRAAAFAVNSDGAGHVAASCARQGVRLVHMSTDYVFSGNGPGPYAEHATVGPLNVYGESKLAGEAAVAASGCTALVVRTQSLFGLHGRNFVDAICGKLEAGDAPLKVVDDHVSSPTYTRHLADAILRLLQLDKQGIVHVSASGSCSWYAFACAIADRVRPGTEVQPVSSAAFPRPAQRPADAVLDTACYHAWTGHRLPSWEMGLEAYLKERASS